MGEVLRGRDWERRRPQARHVVVSLAAALSLTPACAAKQESAVAASAPSAEVQNLRAQVAERDRQLRQLEGRLALLEASQRELRYALAEKQAAAPRETVRIGERAQAQRSAPPVQEPTAREDKEGPRPMLRLYQDRPSAPRAASGTLSSTSPPSGGSSAAAWTAPQVDERLPIAPVPTLAAVAQRKSEPVAAAPDPGERYRYAIDLVRKREFGEALQVLNDFLVQYADDVRAPRVMFWQGEVLFAQRDYARALAAYERSLAREPQGEKAPDSLLKIGLCYRHLGDAERAQKALDKLRTQFPESAAARMLAREDA